MEKKPPSSLDPKKPMKSIIIMRHGERIDCIDSNENSESNNQLLAEYDPELTEKGIKQALDIGKQIKKCLKKEIDTINLYSSPFTRTLMTGLNIVKKLSLNNNNIYVSNALFEIASLNNFKYYPLNSLLINNKNEKNKSLYEKFINNYLKSINNFGGIKNLTNSEKIEPKYPETFKDAIKRYQAIAEILYETITNNNENNSINIIVTHGYGVQVITEYFFGKTKNKEELLKKEDFFVDYCTSYCFNYINDKELKFIGRTEPSFD